MSSKKTIKINPELFKLNNTSKKRDKKPKKDRPVINVKPNKVKKELLNKIKEYQKSNEERNNDYEKKRDESDKQDNNYATQILKSNMGSRTHSHSRNVPEKKGIDDNAIGVSNDSNDFEDEFNKSLNFLQELSKEKREKMERKKKKKTLKKQRDQVGNVNLDLPSELQDYEGTQTYTQSPSSSPQIEIDIPTQLHKATESYSQVQNYSKNYDNNEDSGEKREVGSSAHEFGKFKNSSDIPYGCLKSGNKPTFREWKRETQKKPLFNEAPKVTSHQARYVTPAQEMPLSIPPLSTIKIQNSSSLPPVMDETHKVQDNSERYRERVERLEQLKQEFSEKHNSGGGLNSFGNKVKKSRNKTLTLVGKNTRITKYKLGKKGRQVSILIKNNETRKNVREDISALKKTGILEIKNYLRKHNLIKAGCDSQNDVLRQIFEQAVLSGEINNINKDNLLHNYFNE
jgi:hypothetical protein